MDTRTNLNTAGYEAEADKFAIELLLSDTVFQDYIQSGYTLDQIARITGYSKKLIQFKKLHD